jgi:Putative zinc-finger
MLNRTPHPTDRDLLNLVDGELSGWRARRVSAHVAGCAGCQARTTAIEESSAVFARAYRLAADGASTRASSVRAALNLRITGSGSPSPLSSVARWACTCAALVVLGVALQLASQRWLSRTPQPDTALEAGALPQPHLTPGVVRPVTARQLCAGRPETPPDIPASIRDEVLREYGMRQVPPHEYELDYLITPALGGADDARNLWPERYTSGAWNAHVKDELEDLLAERVCAGTLKLTTAQRDMAANWIAAYKKYFNTDRPLRVYSSNAFPRSRSTFLASVP